MPVGLRNRSRFVVDQFSFFADNVPSWSFFTRPVPVTTGAGQLFALPVGPYDIPNYRLLRFYVQVNSEFGRTPHLWKATIPFCSQRSGRPVAIQGAKTGRPHGIYVIGRA